MPDLFTKLSTHARQISLFFGITAFAFYLTYVVFLSINRAYAIQADVYSIGRLISEPVYIFLAALLVYKRPQNKISWLLGLFALLLMTHYLRDIVLIRLQAGMEPTAALLITSNIWPLVSGLTFTVLGYIFVLFPNGALPSKRWRFVSGLLIFQIIYSLWRFLYISWDIVKSFSAAALGGETITLYPITKTGPMSQALHLREIPSMQYMVLVIGGIALLVIGSGLICQMRRFRLGTAIERQQVKLVIFVMVFWIILVPILLIPDELNQLSIASIFTPLPGIAMTLAIFRYRLYDIDILIRRTLQYGMLTGIIILLFFGSVILFQAVFEWATGRADSPLITVLTTLMMTALFNPLRARVQTFVDLRFYRSHYDAEKTLEYFSAVVRDEVDVEYFAAALLGAVEETMHPETASLWLVDT